MYYLCGVKKITMQVLVTGNAGFIGYHLSRRLAEEGIEVYGIDSMNDYYVNDEHPEKIMFLSEVTKEGIDICVNDEQSEKA